MGIGRRPRLLTCFPSFQIHVPATAEREIYRMPELPEVETVVRGLIAHGLVGAQIIAIDLRCPQIFGAKPRALLQALTGRSVAQVGRRAKYIVLDLDDGARVLVHLRMTGKLHFIDAATPVGKHDHVVITFTDQRRLVYNDTRKFGRFVLCSPTVNPLAPLGPEPLEASFTLACFKARLDRHKRKIKPVLLDQTVVAGLGNIYVDESLWLAGIHPERPAGSLTPQELKALHRAIRQVLAAAVRHSGTTLGSGQTNFYSVPGHRGRHAGHLNVFRRDGQPCPRCRTILARSVVAQRGTHFCPCCQS